MQAMREVSVLECVPSHSVLTVCSSLQNTVSHRKVLPPVIADELEASFPSCVFTATALDDSLLIAALKTIFGFVHPVTRDKRKVNRVSSEMPQGYGFSSTLSSFKVI